MITLITGAPGAGKTAALVDLLAEIAKGRVIYCDGIPDLTVPHEVLSDANDWMSAPDGSAIVIDEVQRVWRPAGSGARVPAAIEALETHRHRGFDFYLVTQHPNLVHSNVRRLVGRHIHLRDVGLLGRWWYEWPESTDPARFRDAPIKKSYRLPKTAFGLYKSASLHIKPIRSLPRIVFVFAFAVLAFFVLAYMAYRSIVAKTSPVVKPVLSSSSPVAGVVSNSLLPGAPLPLTEPGVMSWPRYVSVPFVVGREPYADLAMQFEGGYVAGNVVHGIFGLVRDGRRVASVSLASLVAVGYTWTVLAPCVGTLRYGQVERLITCAARVDLPEVPRSTMPVDQVVVPSGNKLNSAV